MADDNNDKKVEEVKAETEKAEDAADKAEGAAEKAVEAAEEVKEAAAEVKEEVKEVAKVAQKGEPRSSDEREEKPKATKAVSANLEKIIKTIEDLSVLELADLVHALEERFGVSAAPQVVAGAASAGAGPAGGADEGASEQTTFNVVLADGGANKISVIKAVREIVPTLGLKEAKDLVDSAPKPVLEGANKESANEAKTKLEAAGAKVELK